MSEIPLKPSTETPSAESASPVPFDALGLHIDLLRGIRDLGYSRPTPIQVQAIPPILEARDVVGCAQTGTGKTAAFVLPILQRLFLSGPGRGNVRALIIAPTRELALQSMEHLRTLSRYVPLRGVAIFGGVPMEPQITALSRGVDVISATPGRLLDHIYSGRIELADLKILVLDEADRMLDMGFLPDIQRILSLLPPKRQNLLFSATMPQPILELAGKILHHPLKIQIGARSTPAAGIRQAVYPVAQPLKSELLTALLKQPQMTSVLVFTRTKQSASRVSSILERRGFNVSVLHGDRSQSQRLRALERFRGGRSQVMVATDIAARGIDITDISHVINYDVPATPEDYIHRIGRTARAEATGDAFTLMDERERPLVKAIEHTLGKVLPRVTLPDFPYRNIPAKPSFQRHPHSHARRRRNFPPHKRT
ncbi:MAG: DEAD/DEAH box helicase [Candidatus Omnitrophica bacterium]|nr:DEAD/DEAH box helicase [Candidatus Omnitrophota bacterium]MBI2174319.1 DEAD/DEAH box helicase [Candidatus Omnitrophota bacterium]MBI3010566.1 DEAD/DEAH box helicase [Candidatus Omnitrophota bacterium]